MQLTEIRIDKADLNSIIKLVERLEEIGYIFKAEQFSNIFMTLFLMKVQHEVNTALFMPACC